MFRKTWQSADSAAALTGRLSRLKEAQTEPAKLRISAP